MLIKKQLFEKFISSKWRDPDCAAVVNVPVDSVIVEGGLKNNARDIITSLKLGSSFAVVSDQNTYDVLAKHIEKSLDNVSSVVFENKVKADIKNVNRLIEKTTNCDAIVAVGSGTINDICKYASYLADKPYIVFATAPSMNGYSSANASINVNGHKKSLAAKLPRAIFLDLDILSAAPTRLIKSGLGDSLCRTTAQADWLLSHLLLGTKYKTAPFELLKEYESDLFANSKALIEGDKEVVELLARTLVLSGFGMYICNGSYPASQGEHLIAHTYETVFGQDLPNTYHGEQIGVTTLTMAKIQENILQTTPVINIDKNYESDVKGFLGDKVGSRYIKEYKQKILSPQKVDEINQYISTNWSKVKEQINTVMIPSDDLKKILKDAQAPTTPGDLGWQEDKYKAALYHAKYMRNRFTFLDI